MGSLGFLCPFDYDNYREYINGVVKGNCNFLSYIEKFIKYFFYYLNQRWCTITIKKQVKM